MFSKYAFVVPLKDKKGITIANAFQSNLDNSKRRPNKIWTDQGSEFRNTHFKKWLKDNSIAMYSTHNEGKFVISERFIRTLQNKNYKHRTANSEHVHFNILNDIVDKYNNTYHRTIKIKPINVKNDSVAEYNEEFNEKDPKFKVNDHVRISKYQTIFAKGYALNWSEEILIKNQIKNTVPPTYLISDLNGEESICSFNGKELQKTNQKEFSTEKILRTKRNKLYVKWK